MALLTIPPYITWKGLATNSAIPSFSRPDLSVSGPAFKANPIKHWRKSLTPASTNKSRPTIGFIDRPGGIVFRGTSCGCDARVASKQNYVVEDIKRPFLRECSPDLIVQNPGYKQVGVPGAPGSYQINTGIYETKNLSFNPKKRIVRSGNTNVSRAYHSNTASYLQARCRTYQQKQTFSICGLSLISV